jgi:hypothetical protein
VTRHLGTPRLGREESSSGRAAPLHPVPQEFRMATRGPEHDEEDR